MPPLKLKRHIFWENEKMRVNIAAQTFSTSDSGAFIYLKEDLRLPEFKNARPTANFAKLINNLFNIFNSKSKYAKYSYKCALTLNNYQQIFSYLDECKTYIMGLKLQDAPIRLEGSIGASHPFLTLHQVTVKRTRVCTGKGQRFVRFQYLPRL
jgi:hypothetical protein